MSSNELPDMNWLREIASDATPGPWDTATDWNRYAIFSRTTGKRVVCTGNQNNTKEYGIADWSGADKEDAELICAMRNLLPVFLEAMEFRRACLQNNLTTVEDVSKLCRERIDADMLVGSLTHEMRQLAGVFGLVDEYGDYDFLKLLDTVWRAAENDAAVREIENRSLEVDYFFGDRAIEWQVKTDDARSGLGPTIAAAVAALKAQP